MKSAKRRRKSRKAKRGTYVSKKTGQVCKYRSNWEKLYLEHLDADSSVLSWKYEPFFIQYVSNVRTGRMRKYFPDVLVTFVDGAKKLIEIKPKSKLLRSVVVKKTKAAQLWCSINGITFEIVTEIELKALGLL